MKTYASEIDIWLVCVFAGTLILPLALGVIFGGFLWPALAICGVISAFIIWLYLATKYKVTQDDITVHAGLYKVTIPLSSIVSVTATRDIASSPAFSLNRLEIVYDQNSRILISPKNRDSFLSDIGWAEKLSVSV